MAERIPEDYTIARKYIQGILRWYRADIDHCGICRKFFIRGWQTPDGKEVIFVVFGNRKIFSGREFFEVRNCLPIQDETPLALAIVDSSGAVTIFSLSCGVKKEVGLRTWKPERRVVEENPPTNPEPGSSRGAKRARKQTLTTKEDLELRNIIVIDD